MTAMGMGVRAVFALVADLGARLLQLNPHLGDAFTQAPGVVLIDHFEHALHPGWRQTLLPQLMATFPQIQFIVATHSPEALTAVRAHQIRALEWNPKRTRCQAWTPEFSQGAESQVVLEDILGTSRRPESLPLIVDLRRYQRLIVDGEADSAEGRALRERLHGAEFVHDREWIRIDREIQRQKRRREAL
ncbi:putative ATP-binding protein [Magnetofaba australis IT-1]|uniref:Putative ATP-binding protein n=1 Tax=Magnetofaba australis IT-1 TaxID=1434232 RepID=A0A1Y2K875_9PROT|nr:putative ATP-binding protein [Magnetofaba australis IT-1]